MSMYNFEKIGFLPRSILRTLNRFIKQIGLKTDLFVIYEFRISRYIAIASLQCFFFLIICPWIFQFFLQFFLVNFFYQTQIPIPIQNRDIFINFHQQERAFSKIQTFSQKVYFEKLLDSFKMIQETSTVELPIEIGPSWNGNVLQSNKPIQPIQPNVFNTKYFLECANFYNQQSLSILINWILDLTTLLFFFFLLIFSTPQILIFKTFCIESLLSLNETTKCFFLIFFLDLLVGFHSSKSWGIFLQFFIEHFGFQIHQNFIAFFISTFPVLLDTIFKYWIFRYLNKISPSTVATYQAMIE